MIKNDEMTKVVPAEPGWFLCEPMFHEFDGGRMMGMNESPIVAWCINLDLDNSGYMKYTIISPVCPCDTFSIHEGEAFLYRLPDGTYSEPDGRNKMNKAEAVAHMKEML